MVNRRDCLKTLLGVPALALVTACRSDASELLPATEPAPPAAPAAQPLAETAQPEPTSPCPPLPPDESDETVQTGLEVLLNEGIPRLDGLRVGLITNPTGVSRQLRSNVDLLQSSQHVRLVALFGPEHGVRGEAQAGQAVATSTDPRTGLPVHSLYGQTRQPSPGMLDGLDALVFDMQDVGARYFTYVSTMLYAQEAAAEVGLPFAVLDRPNPLTGTHVEGDLLDSAFGSFVGIHPIPVRHGLTVGELARLFAADKGWPEPLVVAMRGWRREQWFDQTGLPWVQSSPNLPTLDSAVLYPGTCLVEGTNCSEGRGTTRPFELLGAPWIDPQRLAEDLEARQLPGVAFRPVHFTPTFSKHAGVSCGGVQVHLLDREAARPVALGIHLLHALRSHEPSSFAWQAGEARQAFVDLLLGSDQPRRLLDQGAGSEAVLSGWEQAAHAFRERVRPLLLYDSEA